MMPISHTSRGPVADHRSRHHLRTMSGLWASAPSRRRSVGDCTKDRRPRLKALAAESAQERRRQEFISNQRRVRYDITQKGLALEDRMPASVNSSVLRVRLTAAGLGGPIQ